MPTSGTVATVNFSVAKVIEHAMRRAGYVPQRIAGEALQVARELLSSLLAEWINVGMPLWTQEFMLLPLQIGSPDCPTPVGTVDILHAYWRIFQPWRGPATAPDGSDASVLFAGAPNVDLTVAGPNPYVQVNFTSTIEVDTAGVLLGGSTPITTALEILGSTDGIAFISAQTLPLATYTPMVWTYFDLDPSLTAFQYLRIRYNSTDNWTLNQLNYGLANGTDIEAGPLSIDDYYNLPNKQFESDQVVSCYTVRGVEYPTLKLWPTPNVRAFYNGTISALVRRYIQDPGAFTDNLELPQRWLEAIMWRLASRLIHEIPDEWTGNVNQNTTPIMVQIRAQRIATCDKEAARSEQLCWGEERNRGPIRFFPSLRPYTS